VDGTSKAPEAAQSLLVASWNYLKSHDITSVEGRAHTSAREFGQQLVVALDEGSDEDGRPTNLTAGRHLRK
jgi:hypothetical protein